MSENEKKLLEFRNDLNEKYDNLCWSIKRDKNYIRQNLDEILLLVADNMQNINYLPREELYMALNVIKLARSQGYEMYKPLYESQVFLDLDKSYANSR